MPFLIIQSGTHKGVYPYKTKDERKTLEQKYGKGLPVNTDADAAKAINAILKSASSEKKSSAQPKDIPQIIQFLRNYKTKKYPAVKIELKSGEQFLAILNPFAIVSEYFHLPYAFTNHFVIGENKYVKYTLFECLEEPMGMIGNNFLENIQNTTTAFLNDMDAEDNKLDPQETAKKMADMILTNWMHPESRIYYFNPAIITYFMEKEKNCVAITFDKVIDMGNYQIKHLISPNVHMPLWGQPEYLHFEHNPAVIQDKTVSVSEISSMTPIQKPEIEYMIQTPELLALCKNNAKAIIY